MINQKTKFKQTEIGMIPEEWEETKIGEICNIKNGKTNSQDAVEDGTYPLFDRSSEIKKSNKFLFDCEAIIIPGEGKEFIPRYFKGKFDLHQRSYAIWKKEKEVNLKFIYYWILKNRDYLSRVAVGSTVKSLRLNHLQNFLIGLPPLPEQRAIAKILSDLDAKIELNQQMNKTLEAIGQAIFKHWFIDFEFPNEEGKPYKSSGGEMVYNEELGKEIPKGWSVVNINEALTFIKGVEPGYKNYLQEKKSENYLPFFRVQDIVEYGNVPKTFVDRNLLQGKTFNNDDILISLDGAIGRVFIGGQGGYSSGIRKVVAKEKFISKSLIFFFLKSAEFQDSLELFSGGETTIKHAGGAIKNIKFVFKKETCERFAEKINSIFEKMLSNISEIQTLSSLRDSLLPKLMSGKIRVPVEARI